MNKQYPILLFRGNRKDLYNDIMKALNKELESEGLGDEIKKFIKENFIDCEID